MDRYICDNCGSDLVEDRCENLNCEYYGCAVVMQFEDDDDEKE
jgi:hypothetical protein